MNHQDESSSTLIPGIAGYNYADLHKPEKLAELYTEFEHTVKNQDAALYTEFTKYRNCQGDGISAVQQSELLVKMAPLLGAFIAKLFNVGDSRIQQINRSTESSMNSIMSLCIAMK